MRAVASDRYGPPEAMKVVEVDRPVPAADSVLIRVHAVSVNRSDWETLIGRPAYARIGNGLFNPGFRILGSDVAGTVEAVGSEVTRFRVGDEVFGDILYHGARCFAEYVAVPERAPLVIKPSELSFEHAAALPQAGVLALQGMRARGGVHEGQSVLINGAGGGGGTFGIQMAKSLGAVVTGVDNGGKLDLMRSVGADEVIDYTREDFTRRGPRYDRILDFAGHRSVFAHRRALRPDGSYQIVGGTTLRVIQGFVVGGLISKMGSRKLGVLMARPNRDDLTHLAEEVVAGRLRPILDETFPLEEVPAALSRLGEGRSMGKIVIRVLP